MTHLRILLLPLLLVVLGLRPSAAPPSNVFTQRYILLFANLNDPAQVTHALSVLARGAAAGYNGVMLGDTNGEYVDLDTATAAYRANVARVREQAAALGLALVPYSYNPRQVTYREPSLAEALPVRETPFRMHGDTARVESSVTLPAVRNWHADRATLEDSALCVRDPERDCRAMQNVSVTPYRAYELSARVKTAGFSAPEAVKFFVAGVDGTHETLYHNRFLGVGAPLAGTQGWMRYAVRFNSLDNRAVRLYLGAWPKAHARGRVWFADVALREVGLEGTVRRDSLPITVTDGRQIFREGIDYRVGEGVLTRPAGSRIPDGAQLSVSWYLRADMLEATPAANAASDRYDAVQRELATRLDALFGHPGAFMINYDEWRVGNWDPATGHATAGAFLADALVRADKVLHGINPSYQLYVWNDMYDPNANARTAYGMMRGDLTGAWDGLPVGMTVVTWTGGAASLRFFADRGHRQLIAGYYDDSDNLAGWAAALADAEHHGARGITGFLYTTWNRDYSALETTAAFWRARGRWGE
jgi:hypothetical protein